MTTPQYTAGIAAFDDHSHAGYIRPGEEVEGIDALEREYALGHVEANMPSEAYAALTAATLRGDNEALAQLDRDFGVEKLVAESRTFQSTTVHGISLLEGSRALYGDVSYSEMVRLSKERRANEFVQLYDQALTVSDTGAVLTDIPWIDDTVWPHERYKPIARIDPYLYPFGHPEFTRRGSDTPRFRRIFDTVRGTLLEHDGLAELPKSLDDYLSFVRDSIVRRQASGFVGLKIASAYIRSLGFLRRDHSEARAAYNSLRGGNGVVGQADYTVLADYLVYYIAELAVERGLPMQIHTGMGHSEPGLSLIDANPLQLLPLLSDQKLNRLRVILIHGGYPYSSELAAISQAHGNVFLDFSWMPYLQHHTVQRLLQEWLEVLPANKVIFGTDTGQPEFHVSGTVRARRHLDFALHSGVSEGLWTISQAEWLARRVLAENLCSVYEVELP